MHWGRKLGFGRVGGVGLGKKIGDGRVRVGSGGEGVEGIIGKYQHHHNTYVL